MDASPDAEPRRLLPQAFATGRPGLIGLVVITGVGGGLIGVGYLELLSWMSRGLGPTRWSHASHLAILAGVGILIALLAVWLGHPSDVELLVDNIHVLGGPEEVRGLRSLVPMSLLCIATGGALGPEAPLVTTTGSLAGALGSRCHLDRHDLRILTITGMAAGFTVLFGAPLGSAVFSLEILHRRGMEYYEALLPAAIGALCGFAISSAINGVGLRPMWQFPAPAHLRLGDIGYAVAAGVVGAAIAAAFTYLTIGLRRAGGLLPTSSRPVLGGVLLGGLAVISPYALTNGETQLHDLTVVKVAVGTLLLAAGAKLVASAVTAATGWLGGFIIPLFFIGFCLGRAMQGHLPGGSSWALAAGLMVAANVGVTKTPIGSTLVITEMTGSILFPTTLIAALVSLALTSRIGLIDSQRRRLDPLNDDAPQTAAAHDTLGNPDAASHDAEEPER
ncbi:MAG TPA: chloride channel protein [Acidimicrobiales bacterium]